MKRLMMLAVLSCTVGGLEAAAQPSSVASQSEDAKSLYKTLTKEYSKARSAWRKKAQELDAAEDTAGLEAHLATQPGLDLIPRFVAAAEQFSGRDEAVPFLAWVVFNTMPEEGKSEDPAHVALDKLMKVHIASPAMIEVAQRADRLAQPFGTEKCTQVMNALIEQNEDKAVQSNAYFTRARMNKGYGDPPADKRATIIADIKQAMELGAGTRVADYAKGMLFELENLQVGMKAPDIMGADTDGVEFKLSDYRGKVVVLDFWGDW